MIASHAANTAMPTPLERPVRKNGTTARGQVALAAIVNLSEVYFRTNVKLTTKQIPNQMSNPT
ncbi:MAG: hypothetical protein MJE63_20680, partial [Proteobacteria bacterium]|nr:hypothetical protein [Pseudomonadota bacterium]